MLYLMYTLYIVVGVLSIGICNYFSVFTLNIAQRFIDFIVQIDELIQGKKIERNRITAITPLQNIAVFTCTYIILLAFDFIK